MKPLPAVLTIGHSTRALAELLALLEEFEVTTLVDVRRFPGSRRYPHFGGPDGLGPVLTAAATKVDADGAIPHRVRPTRPGGWPPSAAMPITWPRRSFARAWSA